MIDTQQIQSEIERLYARRKEPRVNVPLGERVRELDHLANRYIEAASLLERSGPKYWLPVMQLTGHAVELSLKACLVSARSIPPKAHDPVELYRLAESKGFGLDAPDFAAIVHLRHHYFQDLATGTKFKARYPTGTNERPGGVVPANSVFVAVVNSLLVQASAKARCSAD
jgi:HEPN domain-containing protein